MAVGEGARRRVTRSRVVPALDRSSAKPPWLRPDRRADMVRLLTPAPMAPCRRSSISTAGAWPWATTLNRSCSSTRPSPATRCWWPSNCCTRWTRRPSRGANLKIDFAENRPNPEDLRLEILSAALLVPSLSKDVAADTATLEKAIGRGRSGSAGREGSGEVRCVVEAGAVNARRPEADAAASDAAPDRQLAHRRGMAVAMDRNGGRGQANLRHRIAIDE